MSSDKPTNVIYPKTGDIVRKGILGQEVVLEMVCSEMHAEKLKEWMDSGELTVQVFKRAKS